MTINDNPIEHDLNRLIELIDETDLGLEDWLSLADEIIFIQERLELLAGCLHDLPCRACGGRTDRQPVSFIFSRTELSDDLLDYLSVGAMSGGFGTGKWHEVFSADRIELFAAEMNRRFPKSVASFVSAVAQASLAGWREEIDDVLTSGWLDSVRPESVCTCRK